MTDGLIAALPEAEGAPVRYWRIEAGRLIETDIIADANDGPILLVLPASLTSLRWGDVGELAPKQAEAAARMQAGHVAIGGAEYAHIVAAAADGRVVVATVAATDMVSALDLLARDGVDPDIILPAAFALPTPDTDFVAGTVAGEGVLRGVDVALTDEPALRATIVGDAPVALIDEETIQASLIAQLASPTLNLRQGRFAKRQKGAWGSASQWKLAAWLLAAALLATLLIALISWFKYDRALAHEDAKALAAAHKAMPSIASVETAERSLDTELARRGVAVQRFTSTTAALYAAVQSAPGVTLRDLRQGSDGVVAATLAAPTIEPVNAALIHLQAAGYKVTATPRQDASGLAMAEITLRAQ